MCYKFKLQTSYRGRTQIIGLNEEIQYFLCYSNAMNTVFSNCILKYYLKIKQVLYRGTLIYHRF